MLIFSACSETLKNGRRVPVSIGKAPVFGRNEGVHLPEVNSGLDQREFPDRHYLYMEYMTTRSTYTIASLNTGVHP